MVVVGGGGGGWWVHSEFSILLWSKALVLDLDQAEQYFGTRGTAILSQFSDILDISRK